MTMLPLLVGVIGLSLFFFLVLYFCVGDPKHDAPAAWDSSIEIMRKSPFGRWRY